MRNQDRKHKEGLVEIQSMALDYRYHRSVYNIFYYLTDILNDLLDNQVKADMRKKGYSQTSRCPAFFN